MLDWHSCQICYHLEIKMLLLLFLILWQNCALIVYLQKIALRFTILSLFMKTLSFSLK